MERKKWRREGRWEGRENGGTDVSKGRGREEGWWAWQRDEGLSLPVVSGCRPKRPEVPSET